MRRLAIGGILGTSAFFFGWLYLGLSLDDYSPVSTAISELARTDTSTATAMTVAFVLFSAGMAGFVTAAWRYRAVAVTAAVSAVGSVGVAASPLGTADNAHFAFAALSYLAMALLPIAGARSFRSTGRRISLALGVVIATSLVFSVVGPDSVHGFFQRIGLTLADFWIIAFSVRLLQETPNTTPSELFNQKRLG